MMRTSTILPWVSYAALLVLASAGFETGGCAPSDRAPLGDPPEQAGFSEAGTDAPAPTLLGCSGDLRDVIRSDGTVETTCPPELGCFEARCVPACEAAARATGSIGCDFQLATPVLWYPPSASGLSEVGSQQCYTGIVVNAWATPMKIQVSYGGASLDAKTFARIPNDAPDPALWAELPETGLPSGQVAVLFLSDAPVDDGAPPPSAYHVQCPVPTAVRASTSLHRWDRPITGRGKAFHITTDVPASAYDIFPFGGAKSFAPSASLILPTSAWGTNYVVAGPRSSSQAAKTAGDPLWASPTGNWLQIMAREPTTITIRPTDDLPSTTPSVLPDGGTPDAAVEDLGVSAYVPRSFSLSAGEYLQWNGAGDSGGTVIASDKPVAVVTGNGAFTLRDLEADAAHQQLMPVSAFGWQYAVAPVADGTPRRRLGDMTGHAYRIVAAVDGTKLVFDPPDVAADITLDAGGSHVVSTKKAFLVKSQDVGHPFYLAQYMESCRWDANTGVCLGGPDFVNVLPPDQFLRSYVFYTDVSYRSTALVVTRVRGEHGFADVEIGCAGKVAGFADVGSSGQYQSAVVDLRILNAANGTCSNGVQTAKSAAPFGITVWGLDDAASYAYPAGGNIARINPVVVAPELR